LSRARLRDTHPVEREDVAGHGISRRVMSGVIGIHVAHHIQLAVCARPFIAINFDAHERRRVFNLQHESS